MKTFDEVIKALEYCTDMTKSDCGSCPFYEAPDCMVQNDALEWLKGYRDHIKLDEIRDRCMTDNDPLDWDVLRQMEGTPVWVEVNGAKALHTSGWVLVGCPQFKTWEGVECCSLVKVGVTYALPIAEYGKTWQAYRKERG